MNVDDAIRREEDEGGFRLTPMQREFVAGVVTGNKRVVWRGGRASGHTFASKVADAVEKKLAEG